MHLFSFPELQSQLGLQVHEKVTYAGRMKAKQADLRRKLREGLEEEDTAQQGGEESRLAELQNTPAWRAALIKVFHLPRNKSVTCMWCLLPLQENPELYFRDPRQLLELLTELEEQNLSLIQNSRETEDAQEEFRQVMDYNRKKMEVETNQLTQQIDIMTHTIQRERERAAELELRARLFNFGKYKSDDQEGMFDSLGVKVEEVYRGCVGDSEANLSTLQMLKAIESRLDELLENVEIVPKERLVLAERAKEKERRFRLRDEKMHQDKQHQEERLKRALERAQADVKKTTGKKLMARSQRPARKLKTSQVYDISDKEKEEQLYFFT
ncbi:unnamed protein product [Oncorhynchus mykiss]|uniref:DUF4200 domain-containing protein n=1 Tax=Oncorhynchus mykiss TaxID=8022 RepID=A0A060XW51_ONCMY|nr:unnamed protein product [Oncorhynchus mykiss]